MTADFEARSTLTDRYQTTVPEPVRRALKLRKRDKLQFSISPGGEVVLTRAEPDTTEDPVLGDFLGFLAADMARTPSRLRALDKGLAKRVRSLVSGVKFDLDAPLSADDE